LGCTEGRQKKKNAGKRGGYCVCKFQHGAGKGVRTVVPHPVEKKQINTGHSSGYLWVGGVRKTRLGGWVWTERRNMRTIKRGGKDWLADKAMISPITEKLWVGMGPLGSLGGDVCRQTALGSRISSHRTFITSDQNYNASCERDTPAFQRTPQDKESRRSACWLGPKKQENFQGGRELRGGDCTLSSRWTRQEKNVLGPPGGDGRHSKTGNALSVRCSWPLGGD